MRLNGWPGVSRAIQICVVLSLAACGGGSESPVVTGDEDASVVPDSAGGDTTIPDGQGEDSGPGTDVVDPAPDAVEPDAVGPDAVGPDAEDGGQEDAVVPDASDPDVRDATDVADVTDEDVTDDATDDAAGDVSELDAADGESDADAADGDADADVEPDVVESFCGDGVVDDGEACDPAASDASDLCRSDCSLADGAFCQACEEGGTCASSLDVCFELDSTDVCLPTCDDGETCPDDSTCTEVDGGGSVCVPDALTCDGCIDGDGDGYGVGVECAGPDCNDGDASISPAGTEVCDGADNDCDGGVDEELLIATWADGDNDGYGDPTTRAESCSIGAGRVTQGDDCDDANPEARPNASEVCNGVDDDCDGDVDGAGAAGVACWYVDADGDGFGTGDCVSQCSAPAATGWAAVAGDCNDTSAAVNPGVIEVCNGVDDNCDGETDLIGGLPPGDATSYLLDVDGDGYGDPASPRIACAGLADPLWVLATRVDCDDSNDAISPDAEEVAGDGVDSDCDGLELCWADRDEDGFGDDGEILASTSLTCAVDAECLLADGSAGTCAVVLPGELDCEPADADVYPGATELVNDGIDSNCDALEICYLDVDEDGYVDQGRGDGVPATDLVAQLDCDAVGLLPDPAFVDMLDCDPERAEVNPGETEVAGNHLDDDCDGQRLCWNDNDSDGFGAATTYETSEFLCATLVDGDCNDTRADVNPGASEPTGTEDFNCDGVILCFVDRDNDGYVLPGATVDSGDGDCFDVGELSEFSNQGNDCDDNNAMISPRVTEVPGNDIDENCDGSLGCLIDNDADGFAGTPISVGPGVACSTLPSGDCNDNNFAIRPNAVEFPGDNVDQNCDSFEECYHDEDLDGFTSGSVQVRLSSTRCTRTGRNRISATTSVDCAPTDAAINPGATELTGNEVDENCNGLSACNRDFDGDGHARVVTTDTTPLAQCANALPVEALLCDDTPSRRPGLLDPPDLDAFDSNCDGRDGVASTDRYVTGGSAADIQSALNACRVSGCRVLVATGIYAQTETLVIPWNVGLHGGYVQGSPVDVDGNGTPDTFTARRFGASTNGVPSNDIAFRTISASTVTSLRLTSAPVSGIQVLADEGWSSVTGVHIDGNGLSMGAGVSYVGLIIARNLSRGGASMVFVNSGRGGPGVTPTGDAASGVNVPGVEEIVDSRYVRRRVRNTCGGTVVQGAWGGVGGFAGVERDCVNFSCRVISVPQSGQAGPAGHGSPGAGGISGANFCAMYCDNADVPASAANGQPGQNARPGADFVPANATAAVGGTAFPSGGLVRVGSSFTPVVQNSGGIGAGGGGGAGGSGFAVWDRGSGGGCSGLCGTQNIYEDAGQYGAGGGVGGCGGAGGLDGSPGGHSVGVAAYQVTVDRVWVARGAAGVGGNGQNGGNGAEAVAPPTVGPRDGRAGEGGRGGNGAGGAGGVGGRGGPGGDSVGILAVESSTTMTFVEGSPTAAIGGQGGTSGRTGGVFFGTGPRSARGPAGTVR